MVKHAGRLNSAINPSKTGAAERKKGRKSLV